MKKALTLASLILIFISSFSQITYSITDVPVAGTTQRVSQDTFPLPTMNFGNKGANQIYDFSNLVLYKYDTAEFRVPVASQTSVCPNADVATTSDGINFLLTNTDNALNKLTLEGFQGQICAGQTIAAQYQTKPDLYHFPENYLTNFSGNFYLQQTVTAAQVCQSFPVSNVRLTTSGTYTDTIDGWGKVITPLGAYKCLRNQRKEVTTTTIEAQIFGTWSTVSGPTTTTTIRFTYLTKEAKGSVINFNYDTANVLQSVNWSMIPPTAPVADFSSVVGSAGSVAFTDLSDFYPTSWAWTFGDGGTSTSQNPTHVYAANGTYTVCLTATNAGGNSTQVCHQVVISNVAIAPVAAFTWVNPSGGLVNFTDQSTNGPTSWAWTFGDAGTSTLQSPTHVYAANNTYNVCLTATNAAGSNQHCQNVVVSNVSAGNHPPSAVNDTASVLQPNGLTRNVGNNDADPDGNTICITSVYGSSHFSIATGSNCTSVKYTPDSAFVGYDSCYYIICDNGNPVMCDTGKFVVQSVANPAIYPVAVNDVASVLQPSGTTVNVTTNDTDPNGTFCVTSIYPASPNFAISGCSNIVYTPDSTFTGNDTVWYVICDNGHVIWCDTAMLVVTSNQNSALLPVVSFTYNCGVDGYQSSGLTSSSSNYSGNLVWKITQLQTCHDSLTVLTGNAVTYNAVNYCGDEPSQLMVCLVAHNQFGSDSSCQTICNLAWEGINEITLAGIQMYPNPSTNNIIIDMSKNQDEITRNYSAIEIYNCVGKKVRIVNERSSRVLNISVADLPEGMYLATLVDSKGTTRTLGRFTVAR